MQVGGRKWLVRGAHSKSLLCEPLFLGDYLAMQVILNYSTKSARQ